MVGKVPYNRRETVMTKKTSVKMEPHKCTLENRGIAKSTTSSFNTGLFRAHLRATASVADDIVPTAVR